MFLLILGQLCFSKGRDYWQNDHPLFSLPHFLTTILATFRFPLHFKCVFYDLFYSNFSEGILFSFFLLQKKESQEIQVVLVRTKLFIWERQQLDASYQLKLDGRLDVYLLKNYLHRTDQWMWFLYINWQQGWWFNCVRAVLTTQACS